MATDRTLKLVSGYDPDAILPPEEIFKYRLPYRFAIVQPDKIDMFFDVDLFLALLRALSGRISHDRLEFHFLEGKWLNRCWFMPERWKRTVFSTFEAIEKFYQSAEGRYKDPPEQIFWFKQAKVVAMGDSEPWFKTGGPTLYHDSYTISLYTEEDHADVFQATCEEVCRKIGAAIIESVHGDPLKGFQVSPLKRKLLRLFNWFFP